MGNKIMELSSVLSRGTDMERLKEIVKKSYV